MGLLNFIFVDDEEINNMISRVTVELTLGMPTDTQSFCDPREALLHLKTFQPVESNPQTILLLDINMPGMNGWEFLDRFDMLSEEIKRSSACTSCHPR